VFAATEADGFRPLDATSPLPPAATVAAATVSAVSSRLDGSVRGYLMPPMGKADVPCVDYREFMQTGEAGDRAVWHWLRALNDYGLALVQNAPIEDRTVLGVAGRIAPPMHTIYGEVWDVAVMPKPINIAYAPIMLDLHVDLVYYESPPGLQLLHCRRFDPEIRGGQSTFMDAFEVAEAFRDRDPEAFRVMASTPATLQKVHYKRAQPAHIVSQRPHITVDSLGASVRYRSKIDALLADALRQPPPASASAAAEQQRRTALRASLEAVHPFDPLLYGDITGIFWAPPFEGPLQVPEASVGPYFDAYLSFAQLFRQMETEGRHMVEYRMVPGDISVFNNRRVLHGRRTFGAPPDALHAQRVLQGCYLNADDYKSRFTALCSRFAGPLDPVAGVPSVKRIGNQNIL
jgi:gamma-butyrobetaine dioxygenase